MKKYLSKKVGVNQLTVREKIRYKRQMLLDGWGIESQITLKNATVFVAGAGGTGSAVITQLALCGVGNIIVSDFDEVVLSNLNRQFLHDESRIGLNKALSAKMTIKRLNPHINILAYSEKITSANIDKLVGDSVIIFDNVDDLETKFIISEYSVNKKIPHILSSMIDLNSYAVVFHTPKTPCLHCLYDRDKLKEIKEIEGLVENYQKVPNSVASPSLFLSTGFACNEAIKIILGFENQAYNRYFLFNQKRMTNIVNTNGFRIVTYPFNDYFKKICREQGFDWDKGRSDKFIEELIIRRNPNCQICG